MINLLCCTPSTVEPFNKALGLAVLSLERLSSFRSDFSIECVYTQVLSACPLLGGLSPLSKVCRFHC